MKNSKPTTVAAGTRTVRVANVEDIKQKKEPDGNAAGFFCYIGPTFPGYIVHGAVFPCGRDEALKRAAHAIEKIPQVKDLIVPAGELPTARLRVKTPGTDLYAIARRAAGKK